MGIPTKFTDTQTTKSSGPPDPHSTSITWELSRAASQDIWAYSAPRAGGVPTRSFLTQVPAENTGTPCTEPQPCFWREGLSRTWNSSSRPGWPEAPRDPSIISTSPGAVTAKCTPPFHILLCRFKGPSSSLHALKTDASVTYRAVSPATLSDGLQPDTGLGDDRHAKLGFLKSGRTYDSPWTQEPWARPREVQSHCVE